MKATALRRLVAVLALAVFLGAGAFALAGGVRLDVLWAPSAEDRGLAQREQALAPAPDPAPALRPPSTFGECSNGGRGCGLRTVRPKRRREASPARLAVRREEQPESRHEPVERAAAERPACEPTGPCPRERDADGGVRAPCTDAVSCRELVADKLACDSLGTCRLRPLQTGASRLPVPPCDSLASCGAPVEETLGCDTAERCREQHVGPGDEPPGLGPPGGAPPGVAPPPLQPPADVEPPAGAPDETPEQPHPGLARQRLVVLPSGWLRIPMSCEAQATPCLGTLALLAGDETRADPPLAESAFRIEPGATVAQRVRLDRRGRRMLAESSPLEAMLLVEQVTSTGRLATTEKVVLLRR